MKHLYSHPGGIAILLAALAGCSPSDSGTSTGPTGTPTPAGKAPGLHLGCAIPTFSHPFFVAMKKGLEEEARAAGHEITIVDGQDDAQKQLTAIDNFVVQKVDAIILCPTETETLTPGVEKANSAGIPVITVNRTVSGGEVVTYVGADDTDGGRLQGKALIQELPVGGKVALLQGILGSSPQRNREAGLEEALKAAPGIQIVDRIPYDFQRTKAVSKVETLLTKYPKGSLAAIVAQSDDGALAAGDICGQKGRTEIRIIGFNGESDAFEYIKAGKMTATVLQDAETQGREAVKATLTHLKGGTVQNPQITPLFLITRENLREHKPAWQSQGS